MGPFLWHRLTAFPYTDELYTNTNYIYEFVLAILSIIQQQLDRSYQL